MLVSAFMCHSRPLRQSYSEASESGNPDAGRIFTLECYQKAVQERYRFYSFGDAMLVE
jgi:hypothetical protein